MEQSREEKLIMELRTQVNDILSAAELLAPLVRERGGEEDWERLSRMNKGLYNVVRAVNHMDLCWNRDPLCHRRPVDLSALAGRIATEVEGISGDLGVSFRWEGEEKPVTTMADAVLVEQAILNMVTNAFRKAGPGGRVRMRAAAERGRFTVAVWDNGPGLILPDPDASPMVKTGEGVGLGLEAARRVASLHGGALVLENRDGGVCAVLSLPVRAPSEEEMLRDGGMGFDRGGGYSQLLVEFSNMLPFDRFSPEDLE